MRTPISTLSALLMLSATLALAQSPAPKQTVRTSAEAPHSIARGSHARPAVYPENGYTGVVQNPSFTWEAVPGASAYEIEIAADSGFSKAAAPVARVETPRHVPLQPLPPGDLFWRTRPVGADGRAGAWSSARLYKLRAPKNRISIPAGATLAEIRAAIAAAPASSLVTFAPGATYRVKLPGDDTHFLTIKNHEDLIIDGGDSLFIIETPSAGAVSLRDCRRVTLRRFRFDYDPLPHSIGTIEAVKRAPGGAATVTLRRLPGYPDFDAPHMLANWSFSVILDPRIPGRMKSATPIGMYYRSANVARNPAAPGLFDLEISNAGHGKFFTQGDRVIVFARKNASSFCMTDADCEDITFDRVVTHAAPALQFVSIGSTDLKVLSCASVPRDSTRHFAGNADGVHARANRLGPWIEGCAFEGLGDDGVALYNKGMAILANPAPGTLTVDGTFMNFQPGDEFVIFDPFDGRLAGPARTVTAAKRSSSGENQWDISFTPALGAAPDFPIGDATWWKNAQLFNRTRTNAGFVVKNNTFKSIRRYSVIARATDGVIAGNTIIGSSNSGITLLNEPNFWANGLHSERVLIARNNISASTFDLSSSNSAAIAVNLRSLGDERAADAHPVGGRPPGKPERLHRDIRIEDNTITDWNNRAIFLRSVTRGRVTGNTIASTAGALFANPAAANTAIVIDNVRDCVVENNDLSGDCRLTSDAQRIAVTSSEGVVLARAFASPEAVAQRAYQVAALKRIAGPVLAAAAGGKLKEKLPKANPARDRFAPLEALGRTLAGIAPWLELGPGDGAEGKLRAEFIELAVKAIRCSTDPESPAHLIFDERSQPLVDTGFLAQALLRAPTQLWGRFDEKTRANVIASLKASRAIKPFKNNWELFSATVEAALLKYTGECEMATIETAVRDHDTWYKGDGTYGDGAQLHWDYYNSYVIQPMLWDVLAVCAEKKLPIGERLPAIQKRARRYAEIQERMISPEGTFPIIGRSSAYRFGAFQTLSLVALHNQLPQTLPRGAVRAGLNAVIERMIEAPGTFDAQGWLRRGAVGSQPRIAEHYINTGSLYLCTFGLLQLGLPPDDPFWTEPSLPWTQKRLWAGEDMPADSALK